MIHPAPGEAPRLAERPPGTARDYVELARPEQWIKHVFIVPGIVLAAVLGGGAGGGRSPLFAVLVGFAAAAATASANYVLNEWLDAPQDAFHPVKGRRPAVTKQLSRPLVGAEYLGLAATGLALGWSLSALAFLTLVAFLASGLAYNVPPLRTKERAYLDVLSEALNNPIRLTLGWSLVDRTTLPPSSLLLASWMGGAFLMGLKRFAEHRAAAARGAVGELGNYRRSFRVYSEGSLLVSSFLYAQMAAFFLAVFLIKYRVEYLLALPFVAALFASYLRLSLKPESAAQDPEKLIREKSLIGLVVLLAATFLLLTFWDLPVLERLADPHYILLPFGEGR